MVVVKVIQNSIHVVITPSLRCCCFFLRHPDDEPESKAMSRGTQFPACDCQETTSLLSLGSAVASDREIRRKRIVVHWFPRNASVRQRRRRTDLTIAEGSTLWQCG